MNKSFCMYLPSTKVPAILLAGIAMLGFCSPVFSQTGESKEDPLLNIYRASPTKINNVIHTKLDVRFDYAKRQLIGKAWITLKPHFYPTDSLTLDAKGMDIRTVSLVQTAGATVPKFPSDGQLKAARTTPLQYEYDGKAIRVKLNKTYSSNDSYIVFVDYTAKPDEWKSEGSAAIQRYKNRKSAASSPNLSFAGTDSGKITLRNKR